jgi:CubicO group peptidase (beta-lactamase class C family)
MRRPTAWVFASLFFAGLLATADRPVAQSDLPMAKPESVGVSTKRLERVNAYIRDYVDTNQIAGAVTLIARKGKIVHYEAQGWRYKEENQPMTKDSIFTLMSMTKPIVSTALMMLWEDGRFMLDDPIAKWLPAYKDKMVRVDGKLVKPDRPVTVRHVLTHTSGLALSENEAPNPETPAPTTTQTRGPAAPQAAPAAAPSSRRPATLGEAIDRAAPVPLAFHPGDRWQYGASTDYVGVLVEKISGMTLDEFLRRRIFEPLGMRDTHYNVPREKVNRVAAVYRPDPQGKITLFRKPEFREPTTYFPGVAGLSGTAADYFKFSQMLLNGGEYNGQRLLGRMTVDMMFSNHIGAGKNVYVRGAGYGFGLGGAVLTDPAKAPDALSIGTWTWGGAYGTIFWIDPVEELIPIMLIQISPYSHFNIRPLFSVVASQAVVDSLADQKPRVMGYDTPR